MYIYLCHMVKEHPIIYIYIYIQCVRVVRVHPYNAVRANITAHVCASTY